MAAIAFGRPVGAVDVNIRRVLGRIFAADPGRLGPVALQATADALVDPARPGTWTHALMDLGATVCRPAHPACPACPARRWCDSAMDRRAPRVRPSGAAAPPSHPATPFEKTTRWLRGRIVDRLRDAPAGTPVALDGPLGPHSADDVAAAVAALVRDGMLELDGHGAASLPGAPAS